jgi:UDP-glucose 4-epimerase
MKVLITGGAGFVGSHLTDRLIADGHSVVILDNVSTGKLENFKQHESHPTFEYINGSVLDQKLLESAVKDIDYIFHLAAAVGVFNIVNHPLASLVTNICGTENIL